jgi:fructokinase
MACCILRWATLRMSEQCCTCKLVAYGATCAYCCNSVPRKEGDTINSTCPFHSACVEGFVGSRTLAARCQVPAEQLATIPDSDECWETTAFYLAHLCATLALTVSPQVIVLGGGIMQRAPLLPMIRKKCLDNLNGYLVSPLLTPERIDSYIVCTPHGSNAGVLGSLVLASDATQ